MSTMPPEPPQGTMDPSQQPQQGMGGPPGSPPVVMPPTLPPELMPNAFDNHEAHIHYHNQYRKTQEFEMLPDHVKQIFEVHVNTHQQALMLGIQPAGGGPVIGGQQPMVDPAQQMSQQQATEISGQPQQ